MVTQMIKSISTYYEQEEKKDEKAEPEGGFQPADFDSEQYFSSKEILRTKSQKHKETKSMRAITMNKPGDSIFVDMEVHAGKVFNSIIYLHNKMEGCT